jgi:SAM-dependent methyltransferase
METTDTLKRESRPQTNAVDLAAVKTRQQAAWSSGDYALIGTTLQIVGEQLCEALDLRSGQRVLDVAAGNGNVSLAAARRGCEVTSTDYVAQLLARGRARALAEGLDINFREADAEMLPFADKSFDVVVSTFGVMFAINQAAAANELARVCRSGGRLTLATWAPDGAVAEFFRVIAQHSNAPPAPSSPLAWGDPAHVETLLGGAFELNFERGISNAYHESVEDIWDWYTRGFGPLRQLVETLPPDGVKSLKSDVDAYHRKYAVPAGLHVKREYVMTIGRRR